MTAEEFDSFLSTVSQDVGGAGSGLEPASLSENKYQDLLSKTIEKRDRILPPESNPVMVQSIPDGDGYVPVGGGKETRFKGFDAYEVSHPGKGDQSFLNHMARQRQRYSQQFNVPIGQVTDEDVIREGEKDKIRNAARMFGGEAGQTFEPGPITYDAINDPLILGSAENPINAPINSVKLGQDKYKRDIVDVFDTEGRSVNDAMKDPYNALYFNGKRPDINRMKEQNAVEYIKQQRSLGREPSKEEIQTFMGRSNMSNKQKTANLARSYFNGDSGFDNDGYGGQLVDLAQSSLARTGASALDAGATAVGRALGNEDEWKNVKIPFLEKKIDTYKDIDYMDKEFGVNIRQRDKSNAENSAAAGTVKKAFQEPTLENIVGAIKGVGTIGLNFPETFAASAGEMASFAHPAAFAAMIAGRVNTDRETFMKNNPGQEWSKAEEAGSIISNYGVMKIEKLFLGMVGKNAGSALLNPIKKKLIGAITTGAIQVLKSAGMEGAQEYLDQAQQDLMTMAQKDTDFQDRVKKALTSDEAIEGGIIGFGSGGGVASVSPAVGAVKRLPGDVGTMREKMARNKGLDSIDEHLDDVDNDFAKLKIDANSEVAKEYISNIKDARDIVKSAKSSGKDTFSELEKSDNKYVKNFVTAVKTKFVDNNLDEVEADNKALSDYTKTALMTGGSNEDAVFKALKIKKEDAENKTFKEKKALVAKAMEKRTNVNALVKIMGTDAKSSIYDTSFDADTKKKATKDMSNQFERSVQDRTKEAESDIAVLKASKKRLNRTKSAPKIGGEVDTSSIKLDPKPAWGNVVKTLFGKGNKANAIKELGRYTTEALETKAETATPRLKTLIEKTLKKRAEAKSYAGLDANTNTKSDKYTEVKKDEPLGTNKHATMAKAKSMFQRTHYKNQEEVVNAADYINRGEKIGHFSKAQADILRGRLNKIKLKTENIIAKEEVESRKSKEAAKTHFQNVNKGTEKSQNENGESRPYRFKSTGKDGKANYHEGVITFDDRNSGMVHVDFVDEDGETQQLIFGRSKGNQVYVTNQKNQYFEGEEFTRDVDENVDEETDIPDDTTEKTDNPDGTGTNDPTSEASRRANLGVFANQMDIENMTDQELEDMIKDEDLKAIFGC